jgi:phage terminase small subunit
MSASLTFRQERFALEYLKDQNASAAAARAGYTARNMAAQGHELLNNPAIRERVRVEMEAMLAEIRCSAFALMKQRMKAAFFDAGRLFKGGWELRAPEELDEETRAAVEVTSVTRRSGPVVRMRQPDRDRALRALEKVHERLDRLNEAHYAALEKAGKVRSLAEIEAMDAAEPAPQFFEKDQVLSGCGENQDSEIAAKTMVLSGFGLSEGARPSTGSGRTVGEGELGCVAGVGEISAKHQVLSGCRQAPGDTKEAGGRMHAPNRAARRRMAKAACDFSAEPMVLSGSPEEELLLAA